MVFGKSVSRPSPHGCADAGGSGFTGQAGIFSTYRLLALPLPVWQGYAHRRRRSFPHEPAVQGLPRRPVFRPACRHHDHRSGGPPLDTQGAMNVPDRIIRAADHQHPNRPTPSLLPATSVAHTRPRRPGSASSVGGRFAWAWRWRCYSAAARSRIRQSIRFPGQLPSRNSSPHLIQQASQGVGIPTT